VLDILPDQDKIRIAHYCPFYPQAVEAVIPVLDQQADDMLIFKQLSFEQWLKQHQQKLL
jgi:hypothetical protein